ncbi:mitogen-activated protein kinase 1 [Plasmodium gonderi]|uniref:Mitogen-activated protein kinase n=1 Tax=Plasmodium gonderi TaxID=77519 RepID=A0A1Y1JKV8_PLAGO|nr:mitogen-activated protein kinase 1 [Plasmodium gonderi]GAW82920.1 mitogen-activated protein kinase 1 [Plasmodium gonderi]
MAKDEQKNKEEQVDESVLKKYDIVRKIGKGAYGIVYKAKCKKNKKMVAVKKIFGAFQNSTDAQRTFREIMFLYQLNGHDNIIKLMDVIKAKNDNDIYLVFDYMETDLHEVIRADLLEEIHKKYIIYQLLRALKYIHSGYLLHRDIKPSNILLNSECHIKVGDFGLARSISTEVNENKIPVLTDYVATRWYRAPEILLGSTNYTEGVDMWSLGCIMAELLIGKPLFRGNSTMNQLERIIEITGKPTKKDIEDIKSPFAETIISSFVDIKKKKISDIFHKASVESIDLLQKLLQFNPTKRISAENALKHKYVEQFHSIIDEPVCKHIITIPVDDSTKYKVNFYRNIVYYDIMRRKKYYPNQQTFEKSPPSKGTQAREESLYKDGHDECGHDEFDHHCDYSNYPKEPINPGVNANNGILIPNQVKNWEGVISHPSVHSKECVSNVGSTQGREVSKSEQNGKCNRKKGNDIHPESVVEHDDNLSKVLHSKKPVNFQTKKNFKTNHAEVMKAAYANEKYYYEHAGDGKINKDSNFFYYKEVKNELRKKDSLSNNGTMEWNLKSSPCSKKSNKFSTSYCSKKNDNKYVNAKEKKAAWRNTMSRNEEQNGENRVERKFENKIVSEHVTVCGDKIVRTHLANVKDMNHGKLDNHRLLYISGNRRNTIKYKRRENKMEGAEANSRVHTSYCYDLTGKKKKKKKSSKNEQKMNKK